MNRKRFVVELFSGCARLSKACSEEGYISIAYDIEYGSGCDLLNPDILGKICRFLKDNAKDIALVWLGTPCTTWSRAREDDGGPQPLRDDSEHLYGRPNLHWKDEMKVKEGNALLNVSETIILLCQQNDIPWALENPWTSHIWLTRRLQSWCNNFHFIRVDFCAFNMPWRKATGILFGNTECLLPLACQCQTVHGRCGFTNRKHIILVGKDFAGQCLTRSAQPYPGALCRQIAALLTN